MTTRKSRIERREFLRAVGLGAAAMVLRPGRMPAAAEAAAAPAAAGGGGAQPPKRPNILWISAEDLSPTLGCYGDKYATTPNLDRFAGQGLRYEWAFTHAPVCAPARSGLITGQYSTAIGTTWMRCNGVPPPQSKCFPEYLRAAGYYCTNNSKTDYQFSPPGSAWDESSGKAHWRGRRSKDQPFFAVFNLTVTHESSTRSFKPGQAFDHDPAKAPVPPYYPDTRIVRENIACLYDRVGQLDGQIQKVLDELEADGLPEDTIVWFWGDHGWGLTRGKRWIYDSGLRVPLMIRVPAKYRPWAGGGDGQSVAPGTVTQEFARFVDFGPTVLSLAGVQIPPQMQGRAFLGPQKGKEPPFIFAGRDRMDETYDCIRCIRDKQYKYIRNFMPYLTRAQNIDYMDQTPILKEMRRLHAEGKLKAGPQMQFFEPTKPVHELYDILADPHEVNNLAADPKCKDVLERMGQALQQTMKEIGDVGLIPEPDFDDMKGGGAVAQPDFQVSEPAGEDKAVAVKLSCPTRGASITYEIVPTKQVEGRLSNVDGLAIGGAEPPAVPALAAGGAAAKLAKGGKAAKGGRAAKAAKAAGAAEGGAGGDWLVYAGPVKLKPGQALRAQAWRLGFKPSPVATFRYGDKPAPPTPPIDEGPSWREKYLQSGMLDRILAVKAFDGRWQEGLDAYQKALADPAGPVRYWAVVGLHQALKAGTPAERIKPALEPLMKDPSPSVPVAAAEAMVDCGQADKGLARLIEALKSPNEKATAFAAWALLHLGEKARPVLPQIEAAATSGPRYPAAVLKRILARLNKTT